MLSIIFNLCLFIMILCPSVWRPSDEARCAAMLAIKSCCAKSYEVCRTCKTEKMDGELIQRCEQASINRKHLASQSERSVNSALRNRRAQFMCYTNSAHKDCYKRSVRRSICLNLAWCVYAFSCKQGFLPASVCYVTALLVSIGQPWSVSWENGPRSGQQP